MVPASCRFAEFALLEQPSSESLGQDSPPTTQVQIVVQVCHLQARLHDTAFVSYEHDIYCYVVAGGLCVCVCVCVCVCLCTFVCVCRT